MSSPFNTPIEKIEGALAGPWRTPRNMLAEQVYDDHASIHDDETAKKHGFRGGTVEGPTHFSQFAPLGAALWGARFLEEGCLSAHYRNVVYDGEEVRAFISADPGANHGRIWMQKRDGTEVLKGSASIGPDAPPTALEQRLAELPPLVDPVILRDLKKGHKIPRTKVRMDPAQNMGALYPFSLNQKLTKIAEPSPWYSDAAQTPWKRAAIPVEMISVLLQYVSKNERMPVNGPAVGLFADQEIRLIKGPLFVGEDYEIEREVVALTGSKRTESYWTKTRVYKPGGSDVLATMLLNMATFKDSYAPYKEEHARLYPA